MVGGGRGSDQSVNIFLKVSLSSKNPIKLKGIFGIKVYTQARFIQTVSSP